MPIAPNVLGRRFDAKAPNEAWVTDVTYISTAEGWLYLAAILDLFSRRVVGFAMSEQNDRARALEALESFFAPLKAELADVMGFPTREAAMASIGDYLERFYNHARRHSYLGYMSPVEFELRAQMAAFAA